MTAIPDAYLQAAGSAVALLRDPAVAASWGTPSALKDFEVSALAGHLANQILAVPAVLAAPARDEEPISLLDHYARARWVTADLDDESNVRIRRNSAATAAPGVAEVVSQTEAALAGLRDTLPAESGDRPVHLPWGPWSLRVDDFLTTRLTEISVHSDDLAVSVGVATPPLPPAVLDPVLDLLARLAARRHGPLALLRALSRAERAPTTISAF